MHQWIPKRVNGHQEVSRDNDDYYEDDGYNDFAVRVSVRDPSKN